MHPSSLSFLVVTFLPFIYAAITTPINRNGDFVEQNTKGTFCYYPRAVDPTTIDVACLGAKADFAAVMQAQLNRTSTINYFSASLQRLGGPEWVFNAKGRKIYLCMSGRAGDFTYQSMCTIVTRDNSMGNSTICKLEVGQRRVTDGCYVPNQPIPTFTIATTPRPAITTVTRTSAGATGTRASSNSVSTSNGSHVFQKLAAGISLFSAAIISTLVWL